MNILVMGGSGLFGRKTVAALLKNPDVKTVVSMDLAPPERVVHENNRKKCQEISLCAGECG